MSLLSVEAARALVLGLARAPGIEEVALDDACGRVLVRDAASRMTQPPFDAAAMDGYALRSADLPGRLQVVGESAAGRGREGRLAPGQAVRIFTGAPVPEGADRVVMQEHAVREGDFVILETTSGKDHIRRKGNDFHAGEVVPKGRRLTARDIALLAAMNLPTVTVARRPLVAVLAGGDELVRPGETPGAGQIISSNDLAIAALAREAGAKAHVLPLARDSKPSLTEAFAAATALDADLIVTIGGASVGDHDLIGQVAEGLGMTRAFHRISMRPGKPLMAGRLGNAAMLGLPGNPVSAIVTAILFMQPLIRAMQGDGAPGPALRQATLGAALPPEGDRDHYLRARLDDFGDVITACDDQDSARLRVLADADALLIRPAHDPARQAGDRMRYIPLAR